MLWKGHCVAEGTHLHEAFGLSNKNNILTEME